eukprot:TRINITY_DN12587_c0_g1_i1.p1 TRINITY_DN12587_c0_g1~~TRINITY_DN12587_c0_g1_i1.p1  ORF type:complete len:103 (+),score=25.50 TRINITY_DN12587_c0_g1_i1:41-349(+)
MNDKKVLNFNPLKIASSSVPFDHISPSLTSSSICLPSFPLSQDLLAVIFSSLPFTSYPTLCLVSTKWREAAQRVFLPLLEEEQIFSLLHFVFLCLFKKGGEG